MIPPEEVLLCVFLIPLIVLNISQKSSKPQVLENVKYCNKLLVVKEPLSSHGHEIPAVV